MRNIYLFICLSFPTLLIAQAKTGADFGYRQYNTTYKNVPVEILVMSKKGEEQKPKPIFFWNQGSSPIPAIIIDHKTGKGYPITPFIADSILENFHLVTVGKPFVPICVMDTNLNQNNNYIDKTTGRPYLNYEAVNYRDYYVERNVLALKTLSKLPYIITKNMVVAGHSEGSYIALEMALKNKKIRTLIYAGGSPLGRTASLMAESRRGELPTDTFGIDAFNYWKYVVADKHNMDASNGNSLKSTYEYSMPTIPKLEKLKIPVLVCYGTKAPEAFANDYFQLYAIRKGLSNFTFIEITATEHNFFEYNADGTVNYEKYNWQTMGNK